MNNRKQRNEVFDNVMAQNNSDDDLHEKFSSNSNMNDFNLLIDNARNAETSIFDDSSLATVIFFAIICVTIISLGFSSPNSFTNWAPFCHFYSISVRGKTSVAEKIFIDFSFCFFFYCRTSDDGLWIFRGMVSRGSLSITSCLRSYTKVSREKWKFCSLCSKCLFLAVSQDGNLLSESDQIEQITQEIEQHDHLMEPNYKSEQLRIDTIKSMPQSLAAKRMIRARLLRSINRRSHLSSNSSAMRNCKFFPALFLKKVRSWYRQAFKNCDIWYGSMKEIEGRFGSKIGVYFKILRFLVMLNFFVAVFTFR